MRHFSLLLALLGACWLALVVDANADFGAAQLLSGTALLQFDRASTPAFASDGRYVVFRGSQAGVPGIYRRDLQSGQLDMVAGVIQGSPQINAPDAASPSVNADGRYIAFTSAAVLDPAEDTASGCPQVYVRDMSLPPSSSGAYTLVSAVDHSAEGLTYTHPCSAVSARELALGGAQAAPGAALSADGRAVAFTVLSESNLAPGPEGQPTPASQVAVRELDTQTTTLVSATPVGQPTPGGGAFPSGESEQHLRPSTFSVDGAAGSTASISADGSTVAWIGTNVPAQVSTALDIEAGMAGLVSPGHNPAAFEVEPLWRRIADGLGASTRRLLDRAGLNFYFRTFQGETGEPPTDGGAFADGGNDFNVPALSADGTLVAALANAPTAANAGTYDGARISGFPAPPAEAYAIHISDSAPEPQVIPLTATPNFTALNAFIGGVSDVAISPDGSRVAFNTRRESFALTPPALISPVQSETSVASTYEVNLGLGALQRVTSTYDGSPPNGAPATLSFTGDGQELALASEASNLFYGDAVTGAPEVYLVQEISTASAPARESVGLAPLVAPVVPDWILSATATAQTNGDVLLAVRLPGAGKLTVRAVAQLPAPVRSRARRAKGGRAKLTARTVAQTQARPATAVQIQLRVRAGAAYRGLVAERHGLYALLRASFSAPGHKTLTQEIPVTFHKLARKPSKLAKRAKDKAPALVSSRAGDRR